MQCVKRNRRLRYLLCIAYVIGLFVVFYLYVLLRIRPELFYQQNPVVFLFDSDFFAGFMAQPGGPVEYASAFLSPLFVYGWLGALVVTLLTALLCLATRQFLAGVAGTGGWVVFLIPAVLILMVLGQYIHPVRPCVGLFVALVFANAYAWTSRGRFGIRLTAFAVISAFVYYMAAGLYVVLACLCGVFEFGVKRYRLLGVLYMLCAAVVPFSAGWLFDLSVRDSCRGLVLPSEEHWLATPSSVPVATTTWAGLLVFFPVVAIARAWRRRHAVSPVFAAEAQQEGKPPTKAAHASDRPIFGLRLAVQLAALVVLAVGADIVSFDYPKKCLLQMAHRAEHQQWVEVLSQARRLPRSDERAWDPRTGFYVNRALYFSDGLLDRMFTHPQGLYASSLALVYKSATEMAKATPRQCSDIFFDLGRINESEHMAYEALESFGDRPRILKRLVYINVLKGEPELARKFLALLERSLLHNGWARRVRRQLDVDPMLSDVPVVASRRELMVVRDSFGNVTHLEMMLQGLLERNPRNRMAFEYLMAHYLLTRQLDKLAANLHRFDDFRYERLPRHCEEALMIYLATGGSQNVDLRQREISPETQRRFGEFVRIERQFRGDASAAFTALYPDFRDTYFFCYVFGHNNLSAGPSRSSR